MIYLKMEHRPDLSDTGGLDSPLWRKHRSLVLGESVPTPDGGEGRILIRDTWNAAIVSELTPMDGDIVVSKHRYSGFYQTDLDAIRKTLEVKYLIVAGCTTSVCVESTIRDAMFRDYSCVLLEGMTKWGRSGCEELSMDGWISDGEVGIGVAECRCQVAVERPGADL